MPDIGVPELIIILVIVLILFGPGRLTGAGAALGQALREFRRSFQDEPKDDDPL
jgi:sec-independent protein translocase protein TatA